MLLHVLGDFPIMQEMARVIDYEKYCNDMTENDKDYQVRAEIPGAKKEDIRVSVDSNFVSIAAEVRKEKEEELGGRVLVKKTYVGNVARGFSLAHEVDVEGVVAKLQYGVLKLTLPKREGGGTSSIAIE